MGGDDHSGLETWVDYVRGVDGLEEHAKRRAHLSSGCASCTGLYEFARKAFEAGQAAARSQVPSEWTRKAGRIFQDQMLSPLANLPVRRAQATLVSPAPAPAGMRASSRFQRSLAFVVAYCTVDLRVDTGQDPEQLSIVGQIRDSRSPDRGCSQTPVFLLVRNKLVATTASNEFGEFHVACRPGRHICLSFPFDGERIDLMFDQLLAQES
jgi:hypothetical protein